MISDITKDRNADAVTHLLGIIANKSTPDEIAIALHKELDAAYEAGLGAAVQSERRAEDAAFATQQRVAAKARVFAALYIANAREAFKPTIMAADDYTKQMVDTLIANGALADAEALLTRPVKS